MKRYIFNKYKFTLDTDLASTQANQFRKFVTSPAIIQLSIGVIVGGSLTKLIQSVIELATGIFYFLSLIIFSQNHSPEWQHILTPLVEVFKNVLTLGAIAACVFFFVKFINKFFVKEKSETLGYNAQLEETKKLLQSQNETNMLLKESVMLQKKLLGEVPSEK